MANPNDWWQICCIFFSFGFTICFTVFFCYFIADWADARHRDREGDSRFVRALYDVLRDGGFIKDGDSDG